MSQLPLGIGLRDSATFSNFYADGNSEALHCLTEGEQQFVYLWGANGSGKSHLLQAACHQASIQELTAAYVPLKEAMELAPAYLQGLEQLDLVCIDDIQAIAGQREWEEALFHLYNRLRDSGSRLVVAGNASPPALDLLLPDLSSRLAWGLVLQLKTLDDDGKLATLQLRARGRGIELPDEVARYLLRRAPRDMDNLFELLERLDEASLAAQRKLTIPFVRELL